MFDYLEKWKENYKEEERVRCPYCTMDISEDSDYMIMHDLGIPITYCGWPDEEDKTIECPHCKKQFKVREHVRRTYDTCKIDEDFE